MYTGNRLHATALRSVPQTTRPLCSVSSMHGSEINGMAHTLLQICLLCYFANLTVFQTLFYSVISLCYKRLEQDSALHICSKRISTVFPFYLLKSEDTKQQRYSKLFGVELCKRGTQFKSGTSYLVS